MPCRPLAAASSKVMAALAQRGGVTAEIALSEGSAPTLALLQLQQALEWVPAQAGRECALYTAQTLTALAASGGEPHAATAYKVREASPLCLTCAEDQLRLLSSC